MSQLPKEHVTPLGMIRFFQALPSPQTFSIFIDDQVYKQSSLYEDFTTYFTLPSGQHHIVIQEKDAKEPFFEKRINVKPYCTFTYLLGAHPKKEGTLHLYALEDTKRLIQTPIALLRLGHFAKPLNPLNLLTSEEHLLFKGIKYAQLTAYITLEPKTYPFQLHDALAEKDILALKGKSLKKGRFYTFYLIGNGTKDYPYKIVRSIDGPSFLTLEKPSSEAI